MEKKIPNRQMSGLKRYTEQRSQEIMMKVNEAIQRLTENHESITFEAVSKAAGVSRATLYNNVQIKEQIQKIKTQSRIEHETAVPHVKKTKIQCLEEQVFALRNRIKQLEEDKEKLIVQLVDFEGLKKENERLKKEIKTKDHI